MILIEIFLIIPIILFLIPVTLLLLQTICSMPSWKRPPIDGIKRPSVAVLIPAHNEEHGVTETILSIKSQLQPQDRILVIADNCSDGTANAVLLAGAEVCERTDLHNRGKGFALDFGVQNLKSNPPEVVIIIDADCTLSDGSIERLACAVQQTGGPAQSLYLMHAPVGSGAFKKIAEFAWMVKNYVRPLGFKRLGLPCQLMGSGMAFSWPMISNAALANGHVVEDLKLGLDLAKAGTPAFFCPDAKVISYFPVSNSGEKTQRARWEHGHMGMILSMAPEFLMTAVRKRNIGLLGLALDLCVPPIALVTIISLTLFILSATAAYFASFIWPLQLAIFLLAEISAVVFLCWWRYGKKIISFPELLTAPFYMLIKIPLYLRFFVHRQVEWIRTQRDHE